MVIYQKEALLVYKKVKIYKKKRMILIMRSLITQCKLLAFTAEG
jgi:hypothetical protein